MAFAVVGEPVTGVSQHLGQQFGEREVFGQSDVHPALGRADGDPGEPATHRLSSITGRPRLRGRPHFTYHGPGLVDRASGEIG